LFTRFLVYAVLVFPTCLLRGQNGITSHPDWIIKPVYSSGFVMIHRASIGHLVKGYPKTFELNIAKPTIGNKLWHHENNLPDVGITLQCLDFANPSQLGYGLTAAPYVEIPLNKNKRASRVILRVCWGATYLTKRFDIQQNRKNVAIGSHINSFVQFRWFWQLKLFKKLDFEPGITFTHASNGKAKNPNLGLNVVSLSAGLKYTIDSKKEISPARIDSSTRAKSKNEFVLNAAWGFNQQTIGGERLNCYMASVSYQRNVRNTHKFTAGLDVFYDQNYFLDYEFLLEQEPTGIEKYRVAARLGYAYNVGRISFPVEIGCYIFQKANPDALIVNRLGVRYYSDCGLVVNFGLRTHQAIAYAFEYGLGYRFNFK
jgi:hypothetical protein